MEQKTASKKPPEHVEVYFDVRDSSYWYRLNGRFVALGKSDIHMHFRSIGLRDDVPFNGIREIDWPLWNAQMKRLIDYAGPLAGHRTGTFKGSSGSTYLVTSEAAGVFDKQEKLKAPEWFQWFIGELLPGDQWMYFCHWLAIGLESLRKGDFRPGQVVILAGPSGCGKSLLQLIVTEIFGGRSASPFRYMIGDTQFNADLASAEHWQIEDPASTTDMRTRQEFGCRLKEATVNRDFSIHQKGKDALTLPLFRRVTLSVNDETENLAVVPPLHSSIMDKIFLFKCNVADVGDDRSKIWSTVLAEIPAIRAWLLKVYTKIPKDYKHDRFGIKAWHHPELFHELTSLSPETRLLALIDQALFEKDNSNLGPDGNWKGKSMELEALLRKSEWIFEVDKVLRWSGACGAYLSKLAKSEPERVSKKVKHGGVTIWTIKPPQSESDKTTENE